MGSALSNIVSFDIQNPCDDPVFAPVPGSYNALVDVTITCDTPGSSIFYTTDGSTPTPSSTPYIGPVGITNTSVLQAMATAPSFSNSGVTSGLYTITHLPVVTLSLTTLISIIGSLTNTGNLSWNNIGAPAANYRIQRQFNGGGFSTLTTVAVPGTSFADSALQSSFVQGQYDYRIQVLDAGNNVIETTNTVSVLWFTIRSGDDSTGPFGTGTGEGWSTSDTATFPPIVQAYGTLPAGGNSFKGNLFGLASFVQDAGNTENLFFNGTLAQNLFANFNFYNKNGQFENYASAAATFDTATFPGFSRWKWTALHNFPFLNSGITQMSIS